MPAAGDLQDYVRLLAAIVAGAVLGLRAEVRDRPAGLRTHVLVSAGSTLFCITAVHLFGGLGGFRDPLRVVQGVAAGIGFVGAASVLRRGGHVYGVTTAGSVWAAAALGCEAGLGQPLFAVFASLILAAVVLVLWILERRVLRTKARRRAHEGGPGERAPA